MATSTLTTKGQTTIPKEIRERLSLKPGDRIEFVVAEDGAVYLRPITVDIKDLKGLLHQKGRAAVSLEEMKKAVRKRASKAGKP